MEENKDYFIDDKLKEELEKIKDKINEPGQVIIYDEGQNESKAETDTVEKKKSGVLKLQCAHSKCNKIFYSIEPEKYCSEACRLRHHSLMRYNKLKDNEEYKKKVHEKNKKYYEEHKEILKPKMLAYEKEYYKRKMAEKKKREENGNSNNNKETTISS